MIAIKCPKCGGQLNQAADSAVAKCSQCNSAFKLKSQAKQNISHSPVPTSNVAAQSQQKMVPQARPMDRERLILRSKRDKNKTIVFVSLGIFSVVVIVLVALFANQSGIKSNAEKEAAKSGNKKVDQNNSATSTSGQNTSTAQNASVAVEDKPAVKEEVKVFQPGVKELLKPEEIISIDMSKLENYKSMLGKNNNEDIINKDLLYMPYALHLFLEDDEYMATVHFDILKQIYVVATSGDGAKFNKFNMKSKKDRANFYKTMHDWYDRSLKKRESSAEKTIITEEQWNEMLGDLKSTGLAIKTDGSEMYEFRPNTPAHDAYIKIRNLGKKAYLKLYETVKGEDITLSRAASQVLIDVTGEVVPYVEFNRSNLEDILRRWRTILKLEDTKK
ncbi:MAG: hypothetical protein HY606_11230 [Planctomycetes bacterium]|nr:hypothetical protein [Planctomycetota bacterium]